jgi:hypothetical protein
MADISRAAADEILRTLFGGEMWIGLARSSGDEEADPGYRRRRVQLTEPSGEDVRFVTNAEPVVFPPYQQDAEIEVRYAFLAQSESGEPVWTDVIDRPRLPKSGDMVIFPVGSFRIGVP